MGVSLMHSIPGMNLFPKVLCYRRWLQGRYSKGGIGQVRGPVNEVEVVFRFNIGGCVFFVFSFIVEGRKRLASA